MEEQKDSLRLLDMMTQPVFCVKENRIVNVNAAAQQLFLMEGQELAPLLLTGSEEYAAFREGCLYLTLDIAGQPTEACVRKWEDMDIFDLNVQDQNVLHAMALASRELRKPLSSAISNTAGLLSGQEDPEIRKQLAQLNQRLHQMLRILGNMSDVQSSAALSHMETTEADLFFRQIFEKVRTLLDNSGIALNYQGLTECVYCLIDRAQTERAVLNILSNAAKFTPAGGRITASLTRRGRTLRLCVQDNGSGIAGEVMGSLFRRHLRQPGIEDGRFGLGLGIQLIQSCATSHGGTLLVCPGENGGTCVTMTFAIRQSDANALRSPVFSLDYTGGYDHALVELAECLPDDLYDGSF